MAYGLPAPFKISTPFDHGKVLGGVFFSISFFLNILEDSWDWEPNNALVSISLTKSS